ncbi:MAG: LuxR C-terminal-related transcriptional regulator [Actinomycetota bacterium]
MEYRGEGTLPRGLLDLVDAHIDRIGDGALVALAAVSLVQPARRSVVEAAASADALHALTQHQLVVIDGGQNGTVTLSHPLYGETARRRVGARQLDELRLILAEALHDDGAPDINSVALLLDAGAKPDLPALQETTAQLLRLRQGPLAERFARALTDRQPDATAAAHLAASLAIQHRNDEADTFYRQAITEATDPDEQAAIWLGWIRSVFEYRADPGVAIPLADEARHALHGSDRQLATCIWLMSRMFVEPLEPVLDALLRLADHPDVDIRARPIIALNVATSAWHCGYPALTAEWTRRGLHSGEAQTITEGRMRQVEVAGAAWGQSIIEARQRTERFADWVAVNRDLDAEMHLLAARTLVAARAGTAQATVDAVDRFMDLSRRAADRRANGLLSGEWALAASALADRDADTEQALAVLAAMPARARINGEVLEAVARSRMANRRGSADEARRHLHHALDRARWRNSRVHEAITLRELHAWFGPTEETVSRMEELAERAGPGLFRLHAIEARAHLDGDGTALAALSVEAETYGAIGMAWESAAAAYTAHRETGDLAGALAAEIRVEMLGRELPGQLSPLVAAIEPVLSMREREVASAVAAGATNAQAAEQLFLSPRTVQRHLERIFQRLDVGNRGALAELITVEHRPS